MVEEIREGGGYTEFNAAQVSEVFGNELISVMDYDCLPYISDNWIMIYRYKTIYRYGSSGSTAFARVGVPGESVLIRMGIGTGDSVSETSEIIKYKLKYCIDGSTREITMNHSDVTGVSVHVNEENYVYTYLVNDVSGDRKRIVGIINKKKGNLPIGYSQEWIMNIENEEDFFQIKQKEEDGTEKIVNEFKYWNSLAAIGVHKK